MEENEKKEESLSCNSSTIAIETINRLKDLYSCSPEDVLTIASQMQFILNKYMWEDAQKVISKPE